MDYTPEMLAMLERQRAYFASDDHIRREVEPWLDATPEERLAAFAEMWECAEFFLQRQDPRGESALSIEQRFPADTIDLFRKLRADAR